MELKDISQNIKGQQRQAYTMQAATWIRWLHSSLFFNNMGNTTKTGGKFAWSNIVQS